MKPVRPSFQEGCFKWTGSVISVQGETRKYRAGGTIRKFKGIPTAVTRARAMLREVLTKSMSRPHTGGPILVRGRRLVLMSRVLAKRSCRPSPWSDLLQFQIPRRELPVPPAIFQQRLGEARCRYELSVLWHHSGARAGGKVLAWYFQEESVFLEEPKEE